MSGRDKPNPPLWLATRAGKMGLFCQLGTTPCVPQEKFPRKPYQKNISCTKHLYTKLSFASLWTTNLSQSTNTQKNLAILATQLVNNLYTYCHDNFLYGMQVKTTPLHFDGKTTKNHSNSLMERKTYCLRIKLNDPRHKFHTGSQHDLLKDFVVACTK